MPDFLADPSPGLYLALAVFALAGLGVLLRYQDRRSLLRAAACVAPLAAVFLIDRLVETPREAAVRGIEAISAAINARSVDQFLACVSDDFDYHGKKKADLRRPQWLDLVKQLDVHTAVWDFDRDRVTYPAPNAVEIAFNGKGEPKAGAPLLVHFTARFVKNPDGRWRLRTFTAYNIAQQEQGAEETIPSFP